jgi:hypothetical protein
MAKMFGQLPSYILANATSFDIVVTNALAEYENSLANPDQKSVPELSQEEMLEMIRQTRSDNGVKSTGQDTTTQASS